MSQQTRIAYQTDLTQLFPWLLENDVTVSAPLPVSRGHILEYLACLAHQGRSGVSRARKLAASREYFKDLIAEELLSASPASPLALPKKERKSRVYLREDESMKCLNAAAGHNRDDAILPLFLQTGIRLAELAGLILSDLHKRLQLPLAISLSNGLDERVPAPSAPTTRKSSLFLRLFSASHQLRNILFPLTLNVVPCSRTFSRRGETGHAERKKGTPPYEHEGP